MRLPYTLSALFAVVLLFAFYLYSPGLSGPFLLDDHLHLPKLAGEDGQIDSAREFLQLVFSGERLAGRQISYLTLLINDHAWPTDPEGFKRFNVLVHLLNGVLVFVFVRLLARLIHPEGADPKRGDWIALVAMALWLIHPLHLSPTMMVIQRMTLLAGTFSLLALIAYLHGRRLASARPKTGYLWMTLGFGGFLVLGVFSKEPAIMTVGYVLVLEAPLLSAYGPPRPGLWRPWAIVVLGLPLLAIGAYFLSILPYIDQLFLKREFDMGERLMTEARVLMQYLRVILLPSISQSGPYHDDFTISRGLLDPPTTLFSILAIAALIGLALWRRRRNPLLAFALLWFFAGHLLESTILPIELYFEHRNYLPMLGFLFAISLLAFQFTGKLTRILQTGILAFFVLTSSITYVSAQVWGDSDQIALVWTSEHPASSRAQIGAIRFWSQTGNSEALREQFDLAHRERPSDAGLVLLRLIIERCRAESAPSIGGSLAGLDATVPTAPFEHGSLEAIQWISENAREEGCDLSDQDLESIIGLYLSNPRFHGNAMARTVLYRTLSKIHIRRGDLDATMRALDAAYEARPDFDVALNQAWLLASAGLFDDAEAYLERARQTPMRSIAEPLWRREKITEVASLIEAMAMAQRNQEQLQGQTDAQ